MTRAEAIAAARAQGERDERTRLIKIMVAYEDEGGHEDGSVASLIEVRRRALAAAPEPQEEKS